MDGKYDLLSISFILTTLYALSFFSSRFGFFSKKLHSKIWNIALLISFLVAGILGFFLVIQINYKIDVPSVKQIVLLHVDFGIALFLIAVFHILLHLKYFRNLFKTVSSKKSLPEKAQESINEPKLIKPDRWKLFYSIMVLGITSIVTQIIFIREFISVFSGNELLIGMIISIWLILTGTGAYLMQKIKKEKKTLSIISFVHLLLGILPFLTLFCLFVSKNIVFQIGVQISYIQLLLFLFFLLLPFCLTSGIAFSVLSKMISESYMQQKVYLNYSFESLGSMIGGFLFSFILVWVFRTFQILSILFILNFVALYLWMSKSFYWYKKIIFLAISIAILAIGILVDFDKFSKAYIFPKQEIVSITQSPYGQTIITENSGQLNFYQDGKYIFSTDSVFSLNSNLAMDEESVHFGAVQHSMPQNVLCISGGLGGCIHEILKYSIQSIDYLEIDKSIIQMALKYHADIKNDKVKALNIDAREFIKKCNKKYDLVYIFVPPPSNAETNRFYTHEFFEMLKNNMSHESFLSLSLPSTENYLDPIALMSNRIIYNTLSLCFKHVRVFPGEKNYFIASDYPIKTNVVAKIAEKNVKNEYVGYYLDDISLASRSDQMMQLIQVESPINKDLKPMSYLMQIKRDWSIFSGSYWVFAIFVVLISIISFRKFDHVRFGMFAAGFASISAELAIIYLFQMVFGNAYYFTGIVFAVFMMGMVIGPYITIFRNRFLPEQAFKFSIISLGLAVSFFPLLLKMTIEIDLPKTILYILFFFSTFLVGCITAFAFKQASFLVQKRAETVAGNLYSADLFGSAYGALIISVFVIPLLGLVLSGIPGGILCLLSFIFLIKK